MCTFGAWRNWGDHYLPNALRSFCIFRFAAGQRSEKGIHLYCPWWGRKWTDKVIWSSGHALSGFSYIFPCTCSLYFPKYITLWDSFIDDSSVTALSLSGLWWIRSRAWGRKKKKSLDEMSVTEQHTHMRWHLESGVVGQWKPTQTPGDHVRLHADSNVHLWLNRGTTVLL